MLKDEKKRPYGQLAQPPHFHPCYAPFCQIHPPSLCFSDGASTWMNHTDLHIHIFRHFNRTDL